MAYSATAFAAELALVTADTALTWSAIADIVKGQLAMASLSKSTVVSYTINGHTVQHSLAQAQHFYDFCRQKAADDGGGIFLVGAELP